MTGGNSETEASEPSSVEACQLSLSVCLEHPLSRNCHPVTAPALWRGRMCQLPQGSQAFKSSQARCRLSKGVIRKADSPPQLFLLPQVKSHPATPVLPPENPGTGKPTHHPHCLFSGFLTQGCKRIKWQLFYTRFWMA